MVCGFYEESHVKILIHLLVSASKVVYQLQLTPGMLRYSVTLID